MCVCVYVCVYVQMCVYTLACMCACDCVYVHCVILSSYLGTPDFDDVFWGPFLILNFNSNKQDANSSIVDLI